MLKELSGSARSFVSWFVASIFNGGVVLLMAAHLLNSHIYKDSEMGFSAHKEEMALWRIMVDCLFTESKVFHFHKEEFSGYL